MSALHTITAGTTTTDESGRETSRWFPDPVQRLSSSLPLSEKTELSSLPVITPAGLQQTTLATVSQSDPRPFSNSVSMESGPVPASPDKKLTKSQPKGTLEYKVGRNDTLEKIAAHFDSTPSELKKLNRMSLHMVFENQVLYIPDPNYVPSDPPTPERASPPYSPVDSRPMIDIPIVKMADQSPAKVPGHVMKIPSPPASAPPFIHPTAPLRQVSIEDKEGKKLDEECHERFIKLYAQLISEGFEKVPGTLLVTPNAIMFDPDVTDDRVIEEGSEQYGVVVYMDTVMSAALYQDYSAVCFQTRCSSHTELSEKPAIYHGDLRVRSASASDILDPKSDTATYSSMNQAVSNSKSMSGFSPHPGTEPQHSSIGDNQLFPAFKSSEQSTVDGTSCSLYAEKKDDSMGNDLQTKNWRMMDIGGDVHETCMDGASELESSLNGQSMDACNITTDVTHEGQPQGQQDVADSGTVADQIVQSGPVQSEQLDQESAKALLAGGRRDSVNALVSDVDGRAATEDTSDSSDLLMRKCAEELVAEILESVSSGTTQNNAKILGSSAPVPSDIQTDGENEAADRTRANRGAGQGDSDMKVTQDSGKEGEELRIGNIVYLPVEENSQGEMVVRKTCQTLMPETAELSRTHTGTKHRPPPLSSLGVDTTDSASPASADGLKPRSVSESFSPLTPLRSSAQHISNFVNYATGFFRSSSDDRASVKDINDIPVVKDRSAKTSDMDRLKKGEGQQFESSAEFGAELKIESVIKAEERPELFRQVSDLIPPPEDIHKQPAIYLHLHVDPAECDRRVTASTPCEAYRHQVTKPHYWFSVPRNKADHLYAFFVQWRPELYSDDDDINPEDRGFVVVDRVDVTKAVQTSSLPFSDDHFGVLGSSFKKDWEMISREEFRRRSSVAVDLEQICMPELSQASLIMTDEQIMELSGRLPPRTVGYKWSLVYSTSEHGFSLKRLYREVCHIDSPILLVLEDTEDVVFGAYLSDPPRFSDHFYGTGTCQLWTFKDKFQSFGWTGKNVFFIKGDDVSLSVGASQGVYGLWLDSDLYHGCSHECTTFQNCVLSGHEDFILKGLEAWAFLSG